MISQTQVFVNRDDLAAALAVAVAKDLTERVEAQGHATLAVSGGNTPALFFGHLSVQDAPWHKITVTLVDERQVDETSARSNARLVRLNLIAGKAAKANFVPLYENPPAAALNLDVVVLGMGLDGHTASFFPGGDNLSKALDLSTADGIITMIAEGAGEPRLTFTLAKLLQAKSLYLHIEGEDKRRILETAKSEKNQTALPISAVINSAKDVAVFWCP
jgi:6-phosphogluconolactonase